MSKATENEAIESPKAICDEPLTKKELDRLFWRYQVRYLTCCNLENWHGNCYAYDMIPLYKKYYDKDGQRAGMLRMFDFINTEQTTASVLWGILVSMEEQKALGKPVSDDMIRTVKSSLMGPLAGVGDSLVQATILPLLTTIAISLTGTGDALSPLGATLFIIATPILLWTYARALFNSGYGLGKDAVSTLMGSAMDRIKIAIQLFGIVVIGALSASYVKVSTPLSFAASADATPVVLQDVINGIFPNLLSLLLVVGCWFLLSKKGVSITKMIFGLMGVVLVLGLVGIL
ncbi:PTS system mannose/fructose/sorbose family transporter subunit IID [Olsenella massiliensis]|uniref:PTS system mannose/fructose/sorbose family transporter subunit IID n=1 Tax=Olsenella massiliensis TaxID=1622075 RepID=UPI00071DDB5A|nr:PTS system mannose/fructose/sorbose family transporter subunit IID [Olsenella massiliensis]